MKLEYLICLCIFGVVMVARPGAAILCYECNSKNDSRCADEELPDTLLKNCSHHVKGSQYILCRKIVQTIDFTVNENPPDSRTIRSCGSNNSSYSESCYSRGGFGGRQEVCSCMTDKCNHASQLFMGYILFLAPVGLIFTHLLQSVH
ncbi:UPAR/Ly6 domain-containing protein crok-like [Hetaerina americana]|uniref:UPAR/Ly6 domain-containing protein crok-like n=1 Tax=Hetaerina americana TaxID=62018 RepID=UPI003A7F2446